MIIWVTKESVNMACDQRAEVLGTVGGNIRVKLCGTGDEALIAPSETCGVEFPSDSGNEVWVKYKVIMNHRLQVRVT